MRRLGDFSTDTRQLATLSGLALLLGVLATGLAYALLKAIGLVTNFAYFGRLDTALVTPSLAYRGIAASAIPVVGGLVIGLIARYGSEKIRGHGIPEALHAILENESVVQARLLLYKPIASAIAIGTGSPFGAEGPIIMSGGALGSIAAQFLALAPVERRILLVAGAAAGMSATFGSPIAAVFLAVELLLFEWRPRSVIPVAIASVVAYALRVPLLGASAVFPVAHLHAIVPQQLPYAVALGLAVGAASGLLTYVVYAVEDAYHRLPVHWMWWPAIGGVVVGAGGLIAPQALGVGYPVIDALVDGRLALSAVVALLTVKVVIWVASLSSGTSGGVLAPLLMIGAGIGALAAGVIPHHDEALWATIGLAAMLGGTMRAPFTATVFALETTHDWPLVTGVFAASIAATAVTVVFVKRSILTEKLARRGTHVAREYTVHPLERTAVGAIMVPRERVETLMPTLPLARVRAMLGDGAGLRSHFVYPVVDRSGALLGVVHRGRILARHDDRRTVADVVALPAVVRRDDHVRAAVDCMARTGERTVVVLDDDGSWVGLLDQGDVLHAWRRDVVEEEHRRRVRTLPLPRPRLIAPVHGAGPGGRPRTGTC